MPGFLIAEVAILAAVVVVLCLTAWSLFVTRRLMDVTKAQNQRGAAYRALRTAHQDGVDPSEAKATVAAAEKAVKHAEARLPRRSKNTRRYLAAKETRAAAVVSG